MPLIQAYPPVTRERVEEVRAGLQDAIEALNRTIQRAERVFDDLGLHKEASIPLVVGSEGQGRIKSKRHYLVWLVLEGRWQMAVETRQAARRGGTFTSISPLLSTSRTIQMESLRVIMDFHSALVLASSHKGLSV